MSEVKHTPGPWHTEIFKPGQRMVKSQSGEYICTTRFFPEYDDEAHANAYLIAAAPDMMEALKQIEALQSQTRVAFDPSDAESMWDVLNRVFLIARAALEKAENTK